MFNSLQTPGTIACQAPQPMGFSRQEYGSEFPGPSPGDLPNPGIELASLVSPALAGRFFTSRVTYKQQQMAFFYLAPYIHLSVQLSHPVMSDSLRSHGLEHARLPCLSPTPRAYLNSCPLSLWCQSNHLILYCPLPLLPSIFSSIRVFSNESALRTRRPKYWSFSFNISLTMNIHDWFL